MRIIKPLTTLCIALVTLAAAGGIINAQHPAGPSHAPVKTTGSKSSESAAKYFPNTELITQDNQKVKFYDDLLKDRLVVINFIFTTCTSVCPPMTATLARVQKLLAEDGGKGVTIISISVDPTTDTPERLKAYAMRFKAQPGWYFLTGEKANVDVVLQKLGAYVKDKNEHSAILILGNVESGDWKKVYALSQPSQIADHVRQLRDPTGK